jgi:hypothetical protein
MSLCASIEFSFSGAQRRTMMGDWTHRGYAALQPVPERFPINVRSVFDAPYDQREIVVAAMASLTWSAWSRHHHQVRSWLAEYLA